MGNFKQTPAVDPAPLCRVVLRLEYYDPLAEQVRTVPAGVVARLVAAGKGGATLAEAVSDAQGLVVFPATRFGRRAVALALDFANPYLDLNAHHWVPEAIPLDDQRRLIRMPADWDSREQENRFVDDRGGRFESGVLKRVEMREGTAAAPWRVQVDFAWDRFWVALRYYNTHDRQTAGVHPGVRMDAFDGNNLTPGNVIGACTVLDDQGIFSIAIFRPSLPRTRVVLALRTEPNSHYDLREPDPKARRVVRTPEQLAALPLEVRQAHYPLPSLWRSSGQWTRIPGTVMTSWELATKEQAFLGARWLPLGFHLDDFVLVNEAGRPLGWSAENRFTVFDHRLAVRDPDPEFPSWTSLLRSPPPGGARNAFPAEWLYFRAGEGSDACARVVAFRRGFHDLLGRRTEQGLVLGARAAVLNDHPHEQQRDIWTNTPGVGHFDVHYFHECMFYEYNSVTLPLSHVLVHWSARIVREAGVKLDREVACRAKSFPRAEARHSGNHPGIPERGDGENLKEYVIRDYSPISSPPLPPRWTKLRYFIETRQDSNVHCTATIKRSDPNFRSWMSLDFAAFDDGDFEVNPLNAHLDQADGVQIDGHAVAHECGHTFGLLDEYLESIEMPLADLKLLAIEPTVPQFKQEWEGMPLSADYAFVNPGIGDSIAGGRGLMSSTSLLRMRYQWPVVNWMNRNSRVQAALGGKRQMTQYDLLSGPEAGSKLFCMRPVGQEHPYVPSGKQENFHNGTHGVMNLFLHKIGQDEFTLRNAHPSLRGIDSVLTVGINLHWAFVREKGSPPWGPPRDWKDRLDFMRRFEKAVAQSTREEACFVAQSNQPRPGDSDPTRPTFRRVLIHFRPFHSVASDSGAHYWLRLRRERPGSAGMDESDIAQAGFDGRIIRLVGGEKQPENVALLRYLIGISPRQQKADAYKTTIDAEELNFFAAWLQYDQQRTYTIEKIT